MSQAALHVVDVHFYIIPEATKKDKMFKYNAVGQRTRVRLCHIIFSVWGHGVFSVDNR